MYNESNIQSHNDKDIRNRRDILRNGLRLPYNKDGITDDIVIVFYVNTDYINKLCEQVENNK